MERTRFGGSEAVAEPGRQGDPRPVVAESKLEEDPRLRIIWAGYPFAVDFREERGHAYMLKDQTFTRRVTEFKSTGACLSCHASAYVAYKKAGNKDIFAGWRRIYQMPSSEARQLVKHPVSCIDCHDPQSLRLRIMRPAFMEGIKALKASQGIANYDVNTMATAQEMRSYVCGQCHVEYCCKGAEKTLSYPWAKELRVENIAAYYDEAGFKDWEHQETGAAALKAQHPEFEMYRQGVHARAGVSCADCHMPYKREGAHKISDHHVRSPLLNINRACQGCHRFPEQELQDQLEQSHERFFGAQNLAMDALMDPIADLKQARAGGLTEAELAAARDFQRKAQFYLDFVEAENFVGFHAPQESMRILAGSINFSRRGQDALRVQRGKAPRLASVPPTETRRDD